ncbi:MAG TPA: hypothetical protein VG146_13465 [Verrucomicrobiae bacterium]|nr:hypothetical protein [Verrucomicrobiae bacterium]
MQIQSLPFSSFLTLLAVCAVNHCLGSGVTLITHGYAGSADGWVGAMANDIPNYYSFPGTNFTAITITLTTDGNNNYFYQWEPTNATPPAATDSGEIIVKLDWSQMAGGLSAPYDISTYNVAGAASWVMLQTNSIQALGGHALVEFPIHLIGHSRGGSLISEISRILGTNGIWVDHVTTLDPHPLNNDGNFDFGFPTDAPAKNTYANVLFADNYWEDLDPLNPLDPTGEPVAGAYVRQLYNLSEGYFNVSSTSPDHSNVHLWYHGSINLNTPTSYNLAGDAATIDASMRTNWWVPYEVSGLRSGFYYSLIGAGNRLSTDQPLGPGYPAISDGCNKWWDFGAGLANNRTPLQSNSGAWPNLIKLDVTGTNVITQGSPLSARFYCEYGGSASNLTCHLYSGNDFNTLGTNGVLLGQYPLSNTGVGSVLIVNANLSTSNTPPGIHTLYGKIADGSHTRYLVAPELVQITPNQQPPTLQIATVNSNQALLSINGLAGEVLVLQTSSDLQNWVSLATNTLTSPAWTTNVPLAAGSQFYRAVLGP